MKTIVTEEKSPVEEQHTPSAPAETEDQDRYQRAKARVEAIRVFYIHLAIYLLVNLCLFAINMLTDPHNLWFYWPLLGWGIAVAIHALTVFWPVAAPGSDWEQRKIREYMNRDCHDRLGRILVAVSLLLLLGGGPVPGLHEAARAQVAGSSNKTVTRSIERRVLHSTPHAVSTVRIFLVAIGDGGKSGKKIGCGDSLVAVTRPIPPTNTPLSAAFRLLLRDHRRIYGQSGLYNALYQSRLSLQRASVVNSRATVYLVGTMQLGGVCDDPRVGAQLRHTALQFRTVHSVRIYVNGVPLAKRLSEKG